MHAPQLGNKAEDAAYCEQFALTVFSRADRVDRAARADKATAMTFYAASYFMEVGQGGHKCTSLQWLLRLFHHGFGVFISTSSKQHRRLRKRSTCRHTGCRLSLNPLPQILRHFGEPPADIQQKQKYAAWRAAEISKAVKEGRKPDPPPAAGQAALDDEAALLEELAKLEAAGTGAPPGASSAGLSSEPSGTAPSSFPPSGSTAPGSAPSGELPFEGSAAGAPAPPFAGVPQQPPSAPSADGWAPPPPPTGLPSIPSAGSGGAAGSPGSPDLRLPSPPKQRPVESQRSGGVWVPPPPRRFQPFQKVGGGGSVGRTVDKFADIAAAPSMVCCLQFPRPISTCQTSALQRPLRGSCMLPARRLTPAPPVCAAR